MMNFSNPIILALRKQVFPHLTDEKIEVQRGAVTGLRSYSDSSLLYHVVFYILGSIYGP